MEAKTIVGFWRTAARRWSWSVAAACAAWRLVEDHPDDAERARFEAIDAANSLLREFDELVKLAAQLGRPDWRVAIREARAALPLWVHRHAEVRSPMLPDSSQPALAAVAKVRLLADELAELAPQLDEQLVDLARNTFESEALEVLDGAGPAGHELEAFNGCGGCRWNPQLPARGRGQGYERARKALARLVAVGLVERAGRGGTARGVYRITDDGRTVLVEVRRRRKAARHA